MSHDTDTTAAAVALSLFVPKQRIIWPSKQEATCTFNTQIVRMLKVLLRAHLFSLLTSLSQEVEYIGEIALRNEEWKMRVT